MEQIVKLANNGNYVAFEEDFGGNTLTVSIKDLGHTHCGVPNGDFDALIDNLYNSLNGGPGLSWA